MNTKYDQWIQARSEQEIPTGFSDSLMNEVHELDQELRKRRSKTLSTRLKQHTTSLFGAAAVMTGSALGLYRASTLTLKLLFP